MNTFTDAAVCSQFVVTLAHFLWQGLGVAGLALLAGRVLRTAASAVRYLG